VLNQPFSVYTRNNTHNCIVEFACFARQVFYQSEKHRQSIIASAAAVTKKREKSHKRTYSLFCFLFACSNIDDLHVGNEDIMWKDSVKYLGVWLCSGKRLQCDINSTIRKFYAAANSIFSHSGSI